MKRFFVVLASLFVAQQSMATLPIPSLVEYKQVPAFEGVQVPFKSLNIYVNGTVVASVKTEKGSKVVGVKQLTSYEMDEVFENVKDAKNGIVKSVMPGIACFRANEYLHSYKISRGKVLYFGHPCNGPLSINQSEAAMELRLVLNQLVQEMFKTQVGIE